MLEVAAFVNFQHVDREVFRAQVKKLADRCFPRFVYLVGQANDEIDADIFESGGAEGFDGASEHPLGDACGPVARRSRSCCKDFDAEADAIESRLQVQDLAFSGVIVSGSA